MNSLKFQSLLGLILWFSYVFYTQSDYQHPNWHIRILELATLVWLPLGVGLLVEKAHIYFSTFLKNSILATAICLFIALEFHFEFSAFLAVPYVALTLWLAVSGIENWIFLPRHIVNTTLSFSLMMLPVASIWALSFCFNYQPLHFPIEIVGLTAVHFHFAGFLFILFCGLSALHFPTKISFWACRLAILGVPLTAIGITYSQIYNSYIFEMIAAICVTLAGFLCAVAYFIIALKSNSRFQKVASILFAPALIFSMSLAFLYAIRTFYPIDWINIPYMKAIHGTCNGILVPLLGWWCWRK
jgi:hypothetical protein